MFPDLVDLAFLHLKTYGACMALGFMLCWWLIDRLCSRFQVTDAKALGNLVLSLMIAGVVGSRAAYVIEHWQTEFAAAPLRIIRVDQGGLMFYGGLILSILLFFAWCAWKRTSPLKVGNLLAAVVPLGHACGRIGCFCYGCCYGRLSHAAFAVCFPRHSPAWYEQFHHGLIPVTARCSLPVLPAQLFEAAALLVLFAVLLAIYLTWRRFTAGVYLMGYALIRFGLEYLRGDPRAAVGPFSISQFISLLMFALGAALLTYECTRHHR